MQDFSCGITIKDKNFTGREVDIIACLISGRKSKSIANILKISSRTVQVHIANISQKIGVFSQEQITTFIESSDEYQNLRTHYAYITQNNNILENEQELSLCNDSQVRKLSSALLVHYLKQYKLYIALFLCVLFCTISWYLKPFRNNDSCITNISSIQNQIIIERKETLKFIDKCFHQKKANIVAIVGVGGSGKTTIAREYANRSKFDVVWEINSETLENIYIWFLQLANALIKTNEDIAELSFIKAMDNHEEKTRKLIQFISSSLRNKKWLLIFDACEDINAIQSYFPNDASVVNNGNIIITTRNINIENHPFIGSSNTLHIGDLSDLEKHIIFKKILNTASDDKMMQEFLINIPSMPLDVSSAAYYIKNVAISYDQYLSLLKSYHKQFDRAQGKFLIENLSYNKTRYSIVSSSVQNLINQNKKYKSLFFLLCLLDGQEIDVEYFKSISDDFTVNDFIHELKKHSFIKVNKVNKKLYITIHKVNQELAVRYLSEVLSSNEKEDILNTIIHNIADAKKIAWFLYEHTSFIPTVDSNLLRNLLSLRKKLYLLSLDESTTSKYDLRLLLGILHASKYTKSENEIIELSRLILEKNERHQIISDLDLAVVYEIYGNKNIYINTDIAKDALLKCLDLCKKANSSNCIKAICLSDYGHLLGILGDITTAVQYFESAYKIVTPVNHFWQLQTKVTIFNRYKGCFSGYYATSSALEKIIKFGEEILKDLKENQAFFKQNLSQENMDAMSFFMVRRNMADAYNRLGKTELALQNISEAMSCLDLNNDYGAAFVKHKSTIDIDLACVFTRQGKLQDAIDLFSKAIEVKQRIGDKGGILFAFLFRSECYIRMKQYDKAELDCLEILKHGNSFYSNSAKCLKAICLYNLGIIYMCRHHEEKAKQMFFDLFCELRSILKNMLPQTEYKKLIDQNIFNTQCNINLYLKNAYVAFRSIYSMHHPFILDYVKRNIID